MNEHLQKDWAMRASARALRLISLVSVVAVMAFVDASSASAQANFGGKNLDASCCDHRGVRSGIQAPGGNFSLSSGMLGVFRVAAEGFAGNYGGIIQTGFGQTNDATFDECGSRTTLTHYWEYQVAQEGAAYHCAWLDGTPLVYNGTKLYSVYRRSQRYTGNTTTWQANIDGVQKLSVDVNFDSALLISASGELSGGGSGSLSACYACAGSNPWQRTPSAGSIGWTTIMQAQNINTDGLWSIGNLPGPFNVSH